MTPTAASTDRARSHLSSAHQFSPLSSPPEVNLDTNADRLGRLHVITDVVLQTRYTHTEIADFASHGGADTVQYREKRPLLTRELIEQAGGVVAACSRNGAACIVDDRADVTAAVRAGGLHLGRDDLPVDVARSLLGPDIIIGGTANSLEEARVVWQRPIDYLGVGPVYGTQSKTNPAPVLGIEQLRAIATECPVPVIAIGRITAERVAEVFSTGVHGVAVLSAITCAADPEAATRAFVDAIQSWLAAHEGPSR